MQWSVCSEIYLTRLVTEDRIQVAMSMKLTLVIFAMYCMAVAFAAPPGKHVLQKSYCMVYIKILSTIHYVLHYMSRII